MPTFEVRRHAPTKKGEDRGHGSHLSSEGVALARQIGAQIGPFDRVVTSAIPRTLETALAMGFAVDEVIPALGGLTDAFWEEVGRHDHWSWSQPFVQYRQLIALGREVAALGRTQAAIWVKALGSVPPQGALLVISHGHAIEAGLVTCFPQAQLDAFGAPFGHCEGFRVNYRDGEFTQLALQRNTESVSI